MRKHGNGDRPAADPLTGRRLDDATPFVDAALAEVAVAVRPMEAQSPQTMAEWALGMPPVLSR